MLWSIRPWTKVSRLQGCRGVCTFDTTTKKIQETLLRCRFLGLRVYHLEFCLLPTTSNPVNFSANNHRIVDQLVIAESQTQRTSTEVLMLPGHWNIAIKRRQTAPTCLGSDIQAWRRLASLYCGINLYCQDLGFLE